MPRVADYGVITDSKFTLLMAVDNSIEFEWYDGTGSVKIGGHCLWYQHDV